MPCIDFSCEGYRSPEAMTAWSLAPDPKSRLATQYCEVGGMTTTPERGRPRCEEPGCSVQADLLEL